MDNDERYTPIEIIDAVGPFDLDPCAPIDPFNITAARMINRVQNSLIRAWSGRVWLNPPYSSPLFEQFIDRMIDHNNGVALLPNRFDIQLYQNKILPNISSIFLFSGRVRFYTPDGTLMGSPNWGSCLCAFGGGLMIRN